MIISLMIYALLEIRHNTGLEQVSLIKDTLHTQEVRIGQHMHFQKL